MSTTHHGAKMIKGLRLLTLVSQRAHSAIWGLQASGGAHSQEPCLGGKEGPGRHLTVPFLWRWFRPPAQAVHGGHRLTTTHCGHLEGTPREPRGYVEKPGSPASSASSSSCIICEMKIAACSVVFPESPTLDGKASWGNLVRKISKSLRT